MAGNKNQKSKRDKSSDNVKGSLTEEPVNAIFEQVQGRTGARGEVTQDLSKILGGRNEGKTMRRNVKGSVRVGDLLTMRETEIEARRIRKNIIKGANS